MSSVRTRRKLTASCTVFGIVLITGVLLFGIRQHRESSGQEKAVYYFYDETCGSCDREGEFIALFHDRLSGVTLPPDIHVRSYNLFYTGEGLWEDLCDSLAIPEQERMTPMVIAGDAYVTGEENINSQLRYLVCELYQIPDTGTIWYYYRPSCKDCAHIESLMEETIQANPQLSFIQINVDDPIAKEKFKEKLRQRKVPEKDWQVPFLDNGRDYLSGDASITESISDFLKQ